MNKDSILSNCTSGGCGAKIGPGELSEILSSIPVLSNENLLVGYDNSDDAAVYALNEKQSIIATVDFFSPMIDDPFVFGQIAATNALSDIYAMGGTPFLALNLVCFPQAMDKQILGEILKGGANKVAEAGAIIAGGHSIYDKEPKYGLCAIGLIDNERIIRNNTPKIGDKLILTKALGVGIMMAALRGELASAETIRKATSAMTRLNRYAAEKMQHYPVHACTDITGFGLLAHAIEMAGENVSIKFDADQLPYFPEAYDFASEYILSAAGQRNRNFLKEKCDVSILPFPLQELLFDPQTSGGLLISAEATSANSLLADIQKDDPAARIIGKVLPRQDEIILFSR